VLLGTLTTARASIREESPSMTVTTTVREHPRKVSTRELRALELYRTRGRDIQQIAPEVYRVPSQDGSRYYDVLYGELEECPCPDNQHRGVNCVHILAVGIYHAKRRRPHVCNDGWATLGQIVVDDETGEETEEYALYLCRKCAERS
jgi:SWIM zinc finger